METIKKKLASGLLVVLLAILMIIPGVEADLAYWEEKDMDMLLNETREWCEENGMSDWIDGTSVDEDGLRRCCGVTTNVDLIFYDASPETVTNRVYSDRIEEMFNTTVHSIEIYHLETRSGYGIYRIIVKWNQPVDAFAINGKNVYGLDAVTRFYN